jgi:hypothetical protein
MVKFHREWFIFYSIKDYGFIVTTIGLMISLLVGCGALVRAYSQSSLGGGAPFLWMLGIIWLIAYWRRWRWFAGIGLLTLIALAAHGLWISLSPGLMILGALGAVSAWDLQEFKHRLRYALPTEDTRGLERRHISRLLILSLIGFALAGVTEFFPLRLTPEFVFLLGILSVIGLITLGRWLDSKRR